MFFDEVDGYAGLLADNPPIPRRLREFRDQTKDGKVVAEMLEVPGNRLVRKDEMNARWQVPLAVVVLLPDASSILNEVDQLMQWDGLNGEIPDCWERNSITQTAAGSSKSELAPSTGQALRETFSLVPLVTRSDERS